MVDKDGTTEDTPAPRVGGTLVNFGTEEAPSLVCRTDDGRESSDFVAGEGAKEGDGCTIVDK